MNVLQVSTHDVRGGAEQVALNLHRGLRARGHEAVLAVGTRWTDEPGVVAIDNLAARGLRGTVERAASRLADRLPPSLGRPVHAAGLLLQPARLAGRLLGHEDFDMPASRGLLDRLPRPPDVIHLHNLHGGYFDLRELPALSARAPTFLTLHDMWTLTGHCASSLGCERWRDGCGGCPDLRIYPAVNRDATRANLARKRGVYRRSRLRVAAPSRWLLDRARASALADGVVEWRLVPNGVDLGTFHPGDRAAARERLGIGTGDRVLLVAGAGRANPFKDPRTAREAARRARDRSRDGRVRIVVLGAEEDAPAEPGTHPLPFVSDRARLADVYRAADLLLHAAVEDNFPNAVLEALACGTPVVATAVGGIPEQVEDGVTGALVPARDPDAMAEAALAFLRDGPRLAAARVRSAERARERYGLERQTDAWCDWFAEVLAGEAAGGAARERRHGR